MAAALVLMVGRAVLWLAIRLIAILLVLAVVALIFAAGFEVGDNWDAVNGAAPVGAVIHG
ncbi:MAG TPA: hypothetical protein VLM05_18815 [Mycobacteriales bacterium]|nr:hypothetical protein [Mycobacteriales bacterium]